MYCSTSSMFSSFDNNSDSNNERVHVSDVSSFIQPTLSWHKYEQPVKTGRVDGSAKIHVARHGNASHTSSVGTLDSSCLVEVTFAMVVGGQEVDKWRLFCKRTHPPTHPPLQVPACVHCLRRRARQNRCTAELSRARGHGWCAHGRPRMDVLRREQCWKLRLCQASERPPSIQDKRKMRKIVFIHLLGKQRHTNTLTELQMQIQMQIQILKCSNGQSLTIHKCHQIANWHRQGGDSKLIGLSYLAQVSTQCRDR